MRLLNKVAIITGSGSGLGKAIARRFSDEGATVIIADINQEAADATVRELEGVGGTAIAYKVDVTNRAQLRQLMQAVVDRFKRIDILVNNAGVMRRRHFLEMNDEHWDYVLGVNLKGVFYCAQTAAEQMIKQKYGKIVNISSAAGTGTGAHAPGETAAEITIYASSKAAVIQLTKTLARELGPHGINVNCIAPGATGKPQPDQDPRTAQAIVDHFELRKQSTVLNRLGTPQDMANAALFLASDEASFIAGHLLNVDGGRTDRM